MNRLQQTFIWMSRMAHCRGFGIQSPADYHFVRYVVNEHWPYYAYSELGCGEHWLRRKLGRLYFRLANSLQPATVADLDNYAEYISAACSKADISTTLTPAPLIIASLAHNDPAELLQACHENTVLAVNHIWKEKDRWRQLMQSKQATVTFDLYYCGIAFFSTKRTKQHYIVNF